MSCAVKYNCCQQSSLCPANKICKPNISTQRPWKRFTCECPDGYYENDCKQPITSCQDYANGSLNSGIYKVVDFDISVYEVYCPFDADGAWTLVQFHNIANGSADYRLQTALYRNFPISENAVNWRGYRLRRPRMRSIQNNSGFLRLTCDYEKYQDDINETDYVQILLANIRMSGESVVDVLDFDASNLYLTVGKEHGRIGTYGLNDCKIWLHQWIDRILHAHIHTGASSCKLIERTCYFDGEYFYSFLARDCIANLHRCRRDGDSTTQIWFITTISCVMYETCQLVRFLEDSNGTAEGEQHCISL